MVEKGSTQGNRRIDKKGSTQVKKGSPWASCLWSYWCRQEGRCLDRQAWQDSFVLLFDFFIVKIWIWHLSSARVYLGLWGKDGIGGGEHSGGADETPASRKMNTMTTRMTMMTTMMIRLIFTNFHSLSILIIITFVRLTPRPKLLSRFKRPAFPIWPSPTLGQTSLR